MQPSFPGMVQQSPPEAGLNKSLSSATARVRMLEERMTNLRRKLQVTEQNMLSMHRNTNEELHGLRSDVQSLRSDLNDVKNTIKVLVSELDRFAKKDEVRTIKKYLTYWEPIKFVTGEQAEKIARSVFNE
ncbi:MAG: hypothetical protein ABIH34_01055 [Nanoarchaeota archaeon]